MLTVLETLFPNSDITGTGNVGVKDLASDTKVTLTQRPF